MSPLTPLRALLPWLLFCCPSLAIALEVPGETLFRTECARCHGAQGEGTKRHKQALQGDRSIAQLADLIRKTMPEDNPNSLTPAQAREVAEYIHGAFYSPLAQERNRPARIELARLTVRQHRNALADLVGSFRWTPQWGQERGLKAEYYRARRFRPQDRVLQRTDAQVHFDFGTQSPVPDKTTPQEFSIRWNGSILVPETGEYQFVVRTEHAARLWINDLKSPLIDAWVKSGNDTEYQGTLFLVGGRMVPMRLEYSKAKQGVDDSNKKNPTQAPSPKSSIALLWKIPHRAVTPIPTHALSTNPAPEVFSCASPFPPDDRSYGWERGTSVSKEWDAATTEAALETVSYVVPRLTELAGTRDDAPDRVQKIQTFCEQFATRAFRRPLNAAQKSLFQELIRQAKTPEEGVKRVLLLVLKSPRFLYRELDSNLDDLAVAARLSFGLWDSIPDQVLLEAAQNGRLSTPEQVRTQAERMLNDLRARDKLMGFLLTWVRADQPHDLAKDARLFPGFDEQVIADLRTSLELFLEEIVWSPASDFRQLLLADEVHLNERLARFYKVDVSAGSGFRKVKLDADQRAGVLSHPYLMTSFAYNSESSPIHRGVFLARGILGVGMRPPPEAVAPLAPDLHPGLTTRERVTMQTQPTSCMLCHGIINPLGFTMERFDAVGRYRALDRGKPVDSAGSYQTREGKTVQVKGVRELATFLAGSPEAHDAFAEQLFHHLVQQPVRAYGPNTQDQLRQAFVASGFHVRKLAVEVMVRTALQARTVTDARSPRP